MKIERFSKMSKTENAVNSKQLKERTVDVSMCVCVLECFEYFVVFYFYSGASESTLTKQPDINLLMAS